MALIKLRNLRAEKHGHSHVVIARVAGEDVWFSCDELPLRASPEAILSAFLIPAQLKRDRLACQRPVCKTWLSNIQDLLAVTNPWWNRKATVPDAPSKETPTGKRWWRKTALFFTAGVDSFHTLYDYPGKIHALINVHGYDIPLENEARQAGAHASCKAVADARRIPLIQIRTNLREHPYFRKNNWNFTHGGALAAVAHLLGPHFDDFLLSSSTRRDDDRIWGSTWQIDPLWSSNSVRFTGWGEHQSRADKMESIGDRQLVRDHLRVCWKSMAPEANCGVCPKCTRTMVSLEWAGKLAGLKQRFEEHPCLVEAVSRWTPAPIRSLGELDPVLTHPEKLPEPLRSAMTALRDRLVTDMLERQALLAEREVVASA